MTPKEEYSTEIHPDDKPEKSQQKYWLVQVEVFLGERHEAKLHFWIGCFASLRFLRFDEFQNVLVKRRNGRRVVFQ